MHRFISLLTVFSCTCDPQPDPAVPSPPASAEAPPPLERIRVGWQTTWATQGQLAVILMKTDILAQNGFEAEFKGFSYGGPLNEAALAGEVDVLFTADQPALALASRDPSWHLIGRLMYNRVGTFVPPGSPVQSPADLRGRTLAVPFGAAAHREALGALRAAGLTPGTDVQVVNLALEELVALVGAGASPEGRWGSIDAGAAWDPTFADLEHQGAARTVAQGRVTSVVAMDSDYAASARPDAEARFMQAVLDAYGWYRAHTDRADQWFEETSKLPFERQVLTTAASVEPNLQAARADEMSVALSAEDIAGLQAAADFMVAEGLLREPLVVAPPLLDPDAASAPRPPRPGQVQVTQATGP